jgi:putative membrane protein (TIGR04086 family)
MVSESESSMASIRPTVIGSLSGFFLTTLIVVLLAIITEIGWTGLIFLPRSFYLLPFYVGLISGSIIAGKLGQEKGWITGVGVGLVSSILLLILSLIFGGGINWAVFAVKVIINCFIGAFGGIIGVNLVERRNR